MLEYHTVSIIILLNFMIYLSIHIPLDYKTYVNRTLRSNSKSKEKTPPAWENGFIMVITMFSTGYLWFLFIFISLTGLIIQNSNYSLLIVNEPLNTIMQIFGIIIVTSGTIVACLGRISRGYRAISWGIPKTLENKGMFRLIRHPLYASYCYYFVGFFLIFQSLFIIPLFIGMYGYYRTSVYEESILVDNFGEEYIEYQRKTGRFFPRINIRR
ncbi:MAG: methyltransferase family protein [Candidatus Hodarchaeales archaeon]